MSEHCYCEQCVRDQQSLTPPRKHPVQIEYLEAKDAYEQLTAEIKSRVGDYDGPLDYPELAPYVGREADVLQELGWFPVWARWNQAEADLMAWALDIVKQSPNYTPEYGVIFTLPLTWLRKRAIELALQIEAPEEKQS